MLDINLLKSRMGKLGDVPVQKEIKYLDLEIGQTKTIRFLPLTDGNFCKEFHLYYGIASNYFIAPCKSGKPDPVAEQLEADKNCGVPGYLKPFTPKLRCVAPVLVRGEEEKGTRYWEFGKQIYQELLSLANDEDIGDFTDTSNGFDMTVEVVQGNPYPQTSVRVKPKQTPLSDDNDAVEKWTTEQPELFKYFKKYSYDEMKEALAGFLNPEESQESTTSTSNSNEADDIRTGNPLPNDVETKVKGENFGLNVKKKETISADEFDDLFDN